MASIRITRWATVSLATVVMCGVAGLAQPPRPDPINAAKAAQRIADQKATSEVLGVIQDADRTARVNKVKAAQSLKGALLNIDLASGISTETRKSLTALLQAKIAGLEGKPSLNPGAKADPRGAVVKQNQKAAIEAYLVEAKAVREGVDLVKRYQDANRPTEANRLIADLSAKYPSNPAVLSLAQKDNLGKAVEDARQYTTMAEERLRIAQNAPLYSALPPKGDIEFPKDWTKRAGKRTNEVKLTAKEKAIIEALDKPVNLSAKDKPLEYVLQELSTEMDQKLYIDERSLSDLGIDLKKLTSVDARGVSARTALRQVLGAQGLTFVIKGEIIQVLTVDKARETLTTRVYYLGDVVQGVGPFGGGATWGPFLDFQQTMANAQLIVDSIQDSIDPMSWKKRSGPCSITFHFPTMSIVVRASTEVHAALGSKLGSGR